MASAQLPRHKALAMSLTEPMFLQMIEKGLFELLQAHTFAVFTQTLTEPSAAGVLRKYSGKSAGADEGNAQKLYQDLVALSKVWLVAQAVRPWRRVCLISVLIALGTSQLLPL